MKQAFTMRATVALLAAMFLCVAALVWWLIAAGYPEKLRAVASREKPAVAIDQRAPVPAPEKSAPSAVASATETLKGLGEQLTSPPRQSADPLVPAFDIARIEPNGEAVIAGRAASGASVELLRGGVVHDRTIADSSGAFVFVPQPLPPGSYDLTLRVVDGNGKALMSKDAVAVSLSAAKQEKPVVALVAPERPAVVLSKPDPEAAGAIRVDAVEAEEGGKLYVSGGAAPGSIVRLYLNDAFIAVGTASSDGRVVFSIRSGVKAGDYRVRLDRVGPSGNVLSRAEVPFNVPATVVASRSVVPPDAKPSAPVPAAAQAAVPAAQLAAEQEARAPTALPETVTASAGPVASPSSATGDVAQTSEAAPKAEAAATGSTDQRNVVVVPSVDTKVVVRGDNLWRISQASYGRGERYTVIYGANRNQIRDPDLIYPGQIFVLPKGAPQQ